jgi:hypothetical protein
MPKQKQLEPVLHLGDNFAKDYYSLCKISFYNN